MTSSEGYGALPPPPPVRPEDAQWGQAPAYQPPPPPAPSPAAPPSPPWATPPIPSAPAPEVPTGSRPGDGGSIGDGAPDRSRTGAEPSEAPSPEPAAEKPVGTWPKRTRSSSAYAGIGFVLLILVIVLDFIVQNLKEAPIHFFTLHFRAPVGVMVLAGAIAGGAIVLLVSLFRVLQLRRSARRQAKA